MADRQFKQICFTSFKTDLDWFKDWTKQDKAIISYIIIQGELCKDGKQHIQGFCQFTGQKRMSQIKKHFNDNTLHIEETRGTPEQARDYCTEQKNGVWHTYEEYGEIDTTRVRGRRTDLIELKQRIIDGETINQITIETTDNKLQHLLLQYNRGLKELEYIVKQKSIKQRILEQYDNTKWNKLQQKILNIIDEQTDNDTRTINWIYDEQGNTGKSYLAKYLLATKDIYYITGGKQNDILYGYNGQSIIIYDLARTYADNLEHIYTTLENFKNGMYLSTKYETQQRIFNIPTILVLANFKPNKDKLSKDRWNIIDTLDYTEVKIDHNDAKKTQQQDGDMILKIDTKYSTAPMYAKLLKHKYSKAKTILNTIEQDIYSFGNDTIMNDDTNL